jgi:hypothetical protein
VQTVSGGALKVKNNSPLGTKRTGTSFLAPVVIRLATNPDQGQTLPEAKRPGPVQVC